MLSGDLLISQAWLEGVSASVGGPCRAHRSSAPGSPQARLRLWPANYCRDDVVSVYMSFLSIFTIHWLYSYEVRSRDYEYEVHTVRTSTRHEALEPYLPLGAARGLVRTRKAAKQPCADACCSRMKQPFNYQRLPRQEAAVTETSLPVPDGRRTPPFHDPSAVHNPSLITKPASRTAAPEQAIGCFPNAPEWQKLGPRAQSVTRLRRVPARPRGSSSSNR